MNGPRFIEFLKALIGSVDAARIFLITEAFPITAGARLRSPGLPAGRQRDMLDHGIRGRKERALVPVAPPHQVRRAANLASHLGDHPPAAGVTDMKSPDQQFVADLRFHDWLPFHRI
jgi:hypothetical protein